MDWKKFFIAFVAAFGFIFLFGFLWYGKMMHGAYEEVAALWRPQADFGSHFSWLVLGHIVMAFFLTMLYASFILPGGPSAGAKLGMLIGFVYVGVDFISFAVQPWTAKILWGSILGDLIMFTVAGAIIGAIYKPSSPATT